MKRIELPVQSWTFDGHGVTSVLYADTATRSVGGMLVEVMAFSGTVDERAACIVRLPPDWPTASHISLVVEGLHSAPVAGGNIVWEANATTGPVGQRDDIRGGVAQTVTVAAGERLIYSRIVIPLTCALLPEDIAVVYLRRYGNAAADTHATDFFVYGAALVAEERR